MELKWMKNHRDLVEKFIKYGNAYAKAYEKQIEYGTPIKLSAAQIQTLEYILENENQNMSEIAKRLGVSKSTFSRNVNKLMERNLLEKYKSNTNQKDIYVHVSDYGKEIYEAYSKYIYNIWFEDIFQIANQIPEEYMITFKELIDIFSDAFIEITQNKIPKTYTKIVN